MYIRVADTPVFAFAGLWEVWKDPATGELVENVSPSSRPTPTTSCRRSITVCLLSCLRLITTCGFKRARSPDDARSVLRPYDAGKMAAYEDLQGGQPSGQQLAAPDQAGRLTASASQFPQPLVIGASRRLATPYLSFLVDALVDDVLERVLAGLDQDFTAASAGASGR